MQKIAVLSRYGCTGSVDYESDEVLMVTWDGPKPSQPRSSLVRSSAVSQWLLPDSGLVLEPHSLFLPPPPDAKKVAVIERTGVSRTPTSPQQRKQPCSIPWKQRS